MRSRLLVATFVVALFGGLLVTAVGDVGPASATTGVPGTIETVAGGASASVDDPVGVAQFGTTLYIADYHGRVVARDLTTGVTRQYAGLGLGTSTTSGDGGDALSAGIAEPVQLGVDGAGNVYIGTQRWDSGLGQNFDCLIRRIDAVTHIITTVAGVLGVQCGSNISATPEPLATAALWRPTSFAVSNDGRRIFVVDGGSGVLEVDLDAATAQVVAGWGSQPGDGYSPADTQFGGVSATTIGPDGALYLVDPIQNAVRRIAADWSAVDTVVGGSVNGGAGRGLNDGSPHTAQFDFEWGGGIEFRDADSFVVFDGGNDVIRQVDLDGGYIAVAVSTIMGQPGSLGGSGDNGPAAYAETAPVRQFAGDGTGGIYLALDNMSGTLSNRVRHVDAGGTVVDATAGNNGDGGLATDAALLQPIDLVRIGSTLYIAEQGTSSIRAIDLDSGLMRTVAGTGTSGFSGDDGPAVAAQLGGPSALAYDAVTHALLVSGQDARIRRIDLTSGIITTIAGTGTIGYSGDGGPAINAMLGFQVPGLAVDDAGRVFVADNMNRRIRCIGCDGVGIISTYAGTGLGAATDNGMGGATVPSMPAYSTDGDLALDANLVGPVRVAIAPDGAVVFADSFDVYAVIGPVMANDFGAIQDFYDGRVRRIDPVTSEITTIAGVAGDVQGATDGRDGSAAITASIATPMALRFDANGDLYIGEMGGSYVDFMMVMFTVNPPSSLNPAIRKVDMQTGIISTIAGNGVGGFSGDGGPATNASFFVPAAIAPDAGTHLYVADAFNNRIRRIEGVKPNLVTNVSAAPFNAGAVGQIDVAVSNVGTGTATGPIVNELELPSQLAFVSASGGGWSCAPTGQLVRCTRAAHLAAGASTSFSITAYATSGGSMTVSVVSEVGSDSDDADLSNKVTVAGISIEAQADPAPTAGGVTLFGADGGTFVLGDATWPGAVSTRIVDASRCGDGVVATDSRGAVSVAGSMSMYGSLRDIPLVADVVGIDSTDSCGGYVLAASDGGVFTFGDASFAGSFGGTALNAPIVGISTTDAGYRLVAADGGVFSFGDASFAGSLGGIALNAPVVKIVETPTGGGYWLVSSDGGVFAFGDAVFAGSLAAYGLNGFIVDLVPSASGWGYLLVGSDGGMFAFGDAEFPGSLAGLHLNAPVVAADA